MHELLADHMVRWQQEKMRRPEWQHRVAPARRTVSRRQQVNTRVQRLRTRWATVDHALTSGTR